MPIIRRNTPFRALNVGGRGRSSRPLKLRGVRLHYTYALLFERGPLHALSWENFPGEWWCPEVQKAIEDSFNEWQSAGADTKLLLAFEPSLDGLRVTPVPLSEREAAAFFFRHPRPTLAPVFTFADTDKAPTLFVTEKLGEGIVERD